MQHPQMCRTDLPMNENPLTTIIAYIGLGSNLASPIEQIKAARQAISASNDIQERAFSGLYHSAPMGPQDQPDYVNAVMAISTCLPPADLLQFLQTIEHAQGRIRQGQRWGARTLDLDILVYGNDVIELPNLTVPHSGITERAFVLYPLYEIAPQLIIPGKGALEQLLRHCPLNGLQRLD